MPRGDGSVYERREVVDDHGGTGGGQGVGTDTAIDTDHDRVSGRSGGAHTAQRVFDGDRSRRVEDQQTCSVCAECRRS